MARLVTISFLLNKEAQVPAEVRRWKSFPAETRPQKARRQQRTGGERVVPPTENASVEEFIADLSEKYELVDVLYQERPRPQGKGNRPYHMVRFVFALREHACPSPEFRRSQAELLRGLVRLSKEAMWRVLAYKNPLYVDGEEVSGESTFAIDCKARSPYYGGDGKRVVRWRRDEDGERVGEAPIPVTADHCLRVAHDELRLEQN